MRRVTIAYQVPGTACAWSFCRHSVLQPAMFLPHGILPPPISSPLSPLAPRPSRPMPCEPNNKQKWNEYHSSASRPRCDDQTHPTERGTSHGSGLARMPLLAGETTGAAAAQPAVPVRRSAAVAKAENATATVATVAAVVTATNRCRSRRAAVGALEALDWTFWEQQIP